MREVASDDLQLEEIIGQRIGQLEAFDTSSRLTSTNDDNDSDKGGARAPHPEPVTLEMVLELEQQVERMLNRSSQVPEQTEEALHPLASLKAAYNANLPVNRLPAEILDNIFTLLCEHTRTHDPLDPPLPVTSGRSSHSWLPLARVCRHWRDVINAPSARWAEIEVSSTDGAETPFPEITALVERFLQNSAGRLLDVHVSRYDQTRWLRKTLFKHSSRFRSLDLEAFPQPATIAVNLAFPAYNLEFLKIETSERFQLSPHWTAFIPFLFGGVMPRLRYLSLTGWQVGALSSMITTLTHLSLRLVWRQLGNHFSEKFFALLTANLNLQQIILVSDRCGEDPLPQWPEPKSRVTMPSLRRLILCHCEPRSIMALLDRIRCTSGDLTIAVNSHLYGPTWHSDAEYSPSYTSTYDLPDLEGITGLVVDSLPARAEKSHPYVRITGYGGPSRVDLSIACMHADHLNVYVPTLGQLWSACAEVERLTLALPTYDDERQYSALLWDTLFRSLPRLRRLTLALHPGYALAYSTVCALEGPEPVCPLLEEIILCGSLESLLLFHVVTGGRIARARLDAFGRPLRIVCVLKEAAGGEADGAASLSAALQCDGVEVVVRESVADNERDEVLEQFNRLWQRVDAKFGA